jgi:hypothetical protein
MKREEKEHIGTSTCRLTRALLWLRPTYYAFATACRFQADQGSVIGNNHPREFILSILHKFN